MRSFAVVSALAVAAAAQSALNVQSLLSLQSSYISVIMTASDPGAVESSFVNQVTKGLSPQELSAYSSITAKESIGNVATLATDTDLSSLASMTGMASSSATAGSMSSMPTSGMTTSASSSVTAAGGSSSSSGGAMPTNHALNGLMAVAGAVGAAAVLL